MDYFCPSIRMGLLTARALESASLLRSVHVDVGLPPGRAARLLERVAGPRAANRVIADIPPERLHLHPQITVASRVRRRLMLAGRDTAAVDQVLSRLFASVARQCRSEVVVGMQSCSVELFRDRAYRVMEQVSPPLRYERAMAAAELDRFPGWAPPRVARSSAWDHRMESEWQSADQILVPSPHLIRLSAEFGAEPGKFRVVPYPVTLPPSAAERSWPIQKGRRLRLIFAGTLMLEKGVQYIYQALTKRPDLPVQMDFFGPVNLAPLGVSRLAEVGTVHGQVPRSRLLAEFRRADALIFPSLSEGSALVTLEATALGLPVVATGESGAPPSAMLIPARSPEAIIEAIEELAGDQSRLEKLSSAGLIEAANRNPAAYAGRVVGSLRGE
jgi:glycosyltransferase involved in cell wall biosynthesis